MIEFYDYDLSVIESAMDEDESLNKQTGKSSELVESELILPTGARIGHRSFSVYYRQSLRPTDVSLPKLNMAIRYLEAKCLPFFRHVTASMPTDC